MSDIPTLPPYMTQWTGFVLSRVAEMSNAYFENALRPLGINGPHLGVLMALAHNGSMVQARLSDHTRIDKAVMVRLINELESAGYVQRQPNPSDKRAVLVHLTDSGQVILNKAIAIGSATTSQLFSVLTTDEQHLLETLLIRVAERAENLQPDSSSNEVESHTQ